MNQISAWLLIIVLLFDWIGARAKSESLPPSLRGKSIGVYVSSKGFNYDEALDMQITQFLTIGEDRSYVGRLKPELMIRLGWMLSEQLQDLGQADTVHFLNADPPRGFAFREIYDVANNRVKKEIPEALQDIDYVFVINEFDLAYRFHRSSYVRSNRMITERITVKTTSLALTAFSLGQGIQGSTIQVCFDDQKNKKPSRHFDFFHEKSPMGRYLGFVFSQWWQLWLEGQKDNCPEG
ncbi:MAG: hypothetical protein AAF927_06865 [Bacteroidota bacterium]